MPSIDRRILVTAENSLVKSTSYKQTPPSRGEATLWLQNMTQEKQIKCNLRPKWAILTGSCETSALYKRAERVSCNSPILSRAPTFLPSSSDILLKWSPVYVEKILPPNLIIFLGLHDKLEHVGSTQNGDKIDAKSRLDEQTLPYHWAVATRRKISREHPGPWTAHTLFWRLEQARKIS